MEYKHLDHKELNPFINKDSEILILGSFPSIKSRKENFYYSHPRNRFYSVLSSIYKEDIPLSIEDKKTFLKKHKIALYDVIKSCDIKGSSDSSIKNVVPIDLKEDIIKHSPNIKKIIVTGATAKKLFIMYLEGTAKELGIEVHYCPSTSPANARVSLEKLVDEYRIAIDKENIAVYECKYDDLYNLLKINYSNGVLIKIFNEKKHAIGFSNGEVCIGTLEYYRQCDKTNNDGRADSLESVTDYKLIGIGQAADGKPIYMTRQDAMTGLAFCMFYFNDEIENNYVNFKRVLKEMGQYICVVDYNRADDLYWMFTKASFVKGLDNNVNLSIQLQGDNHIVKYKDKPDYSGFEKRIAYYYQQEYRYIFDLRILRDYIKNIDSLSGRYIFSMGCEITYSVFHITEFN